MRLVALRKVARSYRATRVACSVRLLSVKPAHVMGTLPHAFLVTPHVPPLPFSTAPTRFQLTPKLLHVNLGTPHVTPIRVRSNPLTSLKTTHIYPTHAAQYATPKLPITTPMQPHVAPPTSHVASYAPLPMPPSSHVPRRNLQWTQNYPPLFMKYLRPPPRNSQLPTHFLLLVSRCLWSTWPFPRAPNWTTFWRNIPDGMHGRWRPGRALHQCGTRGRNGAKVPGTWAFGRRRMAWWLQKLFCRDGAGRGWG